MTAYLRALVAGALLTAVCALGVEPVKLNNSVPAAVAQFQPIGRLPGTNRLALAIGLPLRNQKALRDLLGQIYNPASPNYRHYLTPEEFIARFGPTEQDYNRVIAFANANGLAVTGIHRNRMLLDVSGSVADIEKALQINLRTYRHPTENRDFYAPDRAPTVDADVPILDVVGLQSYSLPHPALRTKLSNPQAKAGTKISDAGSGQQGSYFGYDFRNAYAPGVSLTGTGQAVALFEMDGYSTNDIIAYENQAGLPKVVLTNILLDGVSGLPSGNGAVEVSLDIEMAIAMAPGLSQVVVYEAPVTSPGAYDMLNRIASDNQARQISSSWVIDEIVTNPVPNQIYQEFAAQGQSFFQASGDEGAYYPGIFQYTGNPYITTVGGTTLTTTNGAYVSEKAWNWGGGSATGGGVSTNFAIPTYQQGLNMSANLGSTTMRNVPDVALTADNVEVIANGGTPQMVGGTSCAAPLWAGFTALINQQAAMTGQPTVGFLNPAVYALGTSTNYTLVFHDITTGNNTNNSSPTKYYAVPGYDLCTGWGTPNGQALINALVPPITLTLPANATEGDGLLSGAGDLQIPTAQTNDLTVTLSSSDPTRVAVSAFITMPAGQTNEVFDLDLLDNGLLEGTEAVTITAAVAGIGTASANITVYDKQPAVLSVTLPPMTAEGSAVQGTVQSSAPPAADVTVGLSSSDTTEIQVPASVILPLGQTSTVFTAMAVTNNKLETPQTVTVTAHVQNWTDGTGSLVVSNTNIWALTLSLPYSAEENAGVLTNAGVVSLSGIMATDLVVSLVSSNAAKLIVPSTVTIPAGQQSAAFNLTLVQSPVPDGHQTVFVTASAPNFANSTAGVFIIDNQIPPPPWSPSPANLAVNVPAMTNLSWTISATTNDVYFGTDPDPGPEDFQGSTTNSTWTLPMLAPLTTYYWQIVAYDGTDAGPVWQFTTAGVDHFAWSTIASPQLVYQPFGVSITAQDAFNNTVSNFNANVSLTGTCFAGESTNEVIGDLPANSLGSGSYTFGYSFTPTNNVTVTEVRSYFGTKVSIWTAAGTLVASQTVVSNSGVWQVTPLTTPVQLLAGNTYFMGAYTGGGEYYADANNSLPWVFPDGTVNGGVYATGDTFPTYTLATFGPLVDLVYTAARTGPLPISPANTVTFANGTWSGELAVPQLATNAVLNASDGAGHGGSSNPFDVDVSNDVSIAVVDLPQPVTVGVPLTYDLTIANTGPTEATEVTVTNLLPDDVTFVSAICSQGTCTQSAGVVIGELGIVPGSSNATMTIVVIPTVAGVTLTNVATVGRGEPDAYYGNNIATTVTPVTLPSISIANSSVVQGTIGTTNMIFALTLNVPGRQTISVSYATTNGTALARTNYVPTNGVVSFPAGVTNQSIAVAVIGNTLVASNKTFRVNLSNPVNGILGQATATGTIIDLNGSPGVLDHFAWGSISSPQLPNQFFQAALNAEDAFDNTVSNFTGNVVLSGTAITSATNRIMGNVTPTSSSTGELTVGYTFTPANDLTVTQFWHYFGSRISLWTGGGTLLATQIYTGTLHAWTSKSLATPVQLLAGQRYCLAAYAFSGVPLSSDYYWRTNPFVSFPDGTINQGVYATGNTFPTNTRAAFWPLVDLGYTVSSTQSVVVSPGSSGPFAKGSWSGNLTVARMATNLVLSANDLAGHSGLSNPFNVTGALPGVLDHFAWNAIPPTRHENLAFAVSITAQDYFNNVVSNFTGTVDLSGTAGNPPGALSLSPVNSAAFSGGVWNGQITVLELATNAVLTADDGLGQTGSSNPFNVSYPLPVAEPAAFSTPLNTPAVFAAAKLTVNDVAFDGGPLTVIGVGPTSAQGGAATLASGMVTYSPPTNYIGNDAFSYTITDAHNDTASGQVTATVGSGGLVSLNIVFGPVVQGGNFVVCFAGVPGLTYTIEAASAITGPWAKVANLAAPATDQGYGVGVFQYTEPVNGDSTRFYRTVYPAY